MNKGIHGISRNAVGPMPDRKARIESRSRKGCWASKGFAPRNGNVASAMWIGSCSAASNNVPIRDIIRVRNASK